MLCTYIFCKDNTKREQNQTIRRMIYAAPIIYKPTPRPFLFLKTKQKKTFQQKTSKKFVSMKRTS